MWAGWVGSLAGIAITTGEIIGGVMAKKTGKTKFQCLAAMTSGTVFLGGMNSLSLTRLDMFTHIARSYGVLQSEYTKDCNGSRLPRRNSDRLQ
jgi:hypothetical protein